MDVKVDNVIDHYYSDEKKMQHTLPVIILAFLFFFPVGIILLYRRMTIYKKSSLNLHKVIKGFGILFILFAIAMIFGESPSSPNYNATIRSFVFLLSFGAFLLFWGFVSKNKSVRYKTYIVCILAELRSIDSIANEFSLSYELVRADLIKMVRNNYFPGAYIDDKKREIVLPNTNLENKDTQTTKKEATTAIEEQNITCSNCGASFTVSTLGDAVCEYCGTEYEVVAEEVN